MEPHKTPPTPTTTDTENTMKSKLHLNEALVESARRAARNIAADTQEFIDRHTTVAVERTVCRLLGIDGVNEVGVPYPNIVVEHLSEKGVLGYGAAPWPKRA